MIISFLNQKGGVGKTTLAVNVTAELARNGHNVLLIDADKQSSASTWASDLTVRQVQQAQEFKNLKCDFVISRKIRNTIIGREIRTMAAASGVPILAGEITQRVAYAESLTMGKTIFEWAPGSPAAAEIERLTKEILSYGQEIVSEHPETKTPDR